MLGVGRGGPRLDPSGLGALDRGAPATGPIAAAELGGAVRSAAADERESWAILASVPGVGPVTFAALLARLGSGRAVVELARGPNGIRRLRDALAAADPVEPGATERPHLGGDLPERIACAVAGSDAYLGRVADLGLEILIVDDPAYPARLRAIEMPPPILFVRGDATLLGARHAVAVVGTRRPSDAGRLTAARIAGALARRGASVVSGLAVGVDGAAHAAALTESGGTVAVLGSGHGRVYPRAHARLADAIVGAGGVVLSELPADTGPTTGTFPRRNRLISGLSDATVVVEAGARSGALITAGWALEQGRECFLVPGSIDAPASRGCLEFLRAYAPQARIVSGVPELIEDLELAAGRTPSPSPPGRPSGSVPPSGGPEAALGEVGATERAIALHLLEGRTTADELVLAAGLPVATILGALTLLEMRGLVTSAYGRYRPAGRLATAEPPRRRRPAGARGPG
jgi:DNA processing protein